MKNKILSLLFIFSISLSAAPFSDYLSDLGSGNWVAIENRLRDNPADMQNVPLMELFANKNISINTSMVDKKQWLLSMVDSNKPAPRVSFGGEAGAVSPSFNQVAFNTAMDQKRELDNLIAVLKDDISRLNVSKRELEARRAVLTSGGGAGGVVEDVPQTVTARPRRKPALSFLDDIQALRADDDDSSSVDIGTPATRATQPVVELVPQDTRSRRPVVSEVQNSLLSSIRRAGGKPASRTAGTGNRRSSSNGSGRGRSLVQELQGGRNRLRRVPRNSRGNSNASHAPSNSRDISAAFQNLALRTKRRLKPVLELIRKANDSAKIKELSDDQLDKILSYEILGYDDDAYDIEADLSHDNTYSNDELEAVGRKVLAEKQRRENASASEKEEARIRGLVEKVDELKGVDLKSANEFLINEVKDILSRDDLDSHARADEFVTLLSNINAELTRRAAEVEAARIAADEEAARQAAERAAEEARLAAEAEQNRKVALLNRIQEDQKIADMDRAEVEEAIALLGRQVWLGSSDETKGFIASKDARIAKLQERIDYLNKQLTEEEKEAIKFLNILGWNKLKKSNDPKKSAKIRWLAENNTAAVGAEAKRYMRTNPSEFN